MIHSIQNVTATALHDARVPIRRLPRFSIVVLGTLVAAALFIPLVAAHDPYAIAADQRLLAPSPEFPFGTDDLGRDVFVRMALGARTSMTVAGFALAVGAGLGMSLGLLAGYRGGLLDSVVSRTADASLAFPTVFFGLLFAVSMGPGLLSVVAALSLTLWARFFRVVRGEALSVRQRDHVAQAIVNGCSSTRIIVVHILPNVVNSFMVVLSLTVGYVVTAEAALSFLGAGVPPPTPSWGGIISGGEGYIQTAWWISVIPGVVISMTILAFNLLGDWLRDYLDPRLRDQL